MKLRFPFPLLQLLSGIVAFASLVASSTTASAQAPTPAAAGTDYVLLKPPTPTSPPRQLINVLITGVRNGKVAIREAMGQIEYDVSQIQEVRKAAPAEFPAGQRFIEAGELDKALPLIKSVADRYKGLPTIWAQDATAMLGNIYLSLGQLAEAEAAFNEFQRAYPGAGSIAASIGKARLAAERGKFAEARSIAEPMVADALTKKNVSRAESQIIGQACFVLGKAAEGEGKLPEAMEQYCRTVAIFYQERSVVAEAQKRIDELRKKGITTP